MPTHQLLGYLEPLLLGQILEVLGTSASPNPASPLRLPSPRFGGHWFTALSSNMSHPKTIVAPIAHPL